MPRARTLAVVGSLGAVAASLLPWSRSGSAVRSGFALARLALGSGLVERPVADPVLLLWLLLPLFAGIAALGAALRSRWLAASAAMVCGIAALVPAIAVLASDLGARSGPLTSVAAGALAVASAAWLARGERGDDDRHPQRAPGDTRTPTPGVDDPGHR